MVSMARGLSKLLKVNAFRLGSIWADPETMLIGDCRLPLQEMVAMVGQVESSANGNQVFVSWREAAGV